MINGYSVEQIRAAEAPHLSAGEPLMRRAAAALALEIRSHLAEHGESGDRPPTVLILVGSGDNGGDALFAGAELAAEGIDVVLVPTGDRMHTAGLDAALTAGARVQPTRPLDVASLTHVAGRSAVIVDGILGTGTAGSPALRGRARDVVAILRPIAESPGAPTVVAVDIPSGIGPDSGSVPDPTVLRADTTVTFGGCKAGLLLRPAADYAGVVRVVDIGIGRDLAAMTPTLRVPSP